MERENRSEFSERARQNLQRKAEIRNIDGKYFDPQPGDKAALLFELRALALVQMVDPL